MMTTKIKVDQHLAEYAIGKWGTDFQQPVRFPDYTDLYHTVTDLTRKRPCGVYFDEGNLEICLPTKDKDGEQIRKNPIVYNYICPESSKIINKKLKLIFWVEVHDFLLTEKHKKGQDFIESAFIFLNKYCISSITPDALIKNFKRLRDKLYPSKKRDYRKKKQHFY